MYYTDNMIVRISYTLVISISISRFGMLLDKQRGSIPDRVKRFSGQCVYYK